MLTSTVYIKLELLLYVKNFLVLNYPEQITITILCKTQLDTIILDEQMDKLPLPSEEM